MKDAEKISAVSMMQIAQETIHLAGPENEEQAPTYQTILSGTIATLAPPLILPGEPAIAWCARTQALPPIMMARFAKPIIAHCAAVIMPDAQTLLYDRQTMHPLRVNGQEFGTCMKEDAGHHVSIKEAQPMSGAAIAMGTMAERNFSNWFHWMIEMLPRFMIIDAFPFLKNLPIIMNCDLSAAQKESLSAIGVSPERIIPNSNDILMPEVAYCPSFTGREYLFSPKGISWLRKRILDFYKIKSRAPQKFLYISREDAPSKRVNNDQEISQVLSQMGFEHFLASEKSFYQQVEAFSQARIIVSAHGAGLANIIFSQPETLVIEFYPQIPNFEAGISFFYPGLSNTCGHVHAVLRGGELDENENYSVNPARLVDLITRMLKGGDLDHATFFKEIEDGLIISN